LKSKPQPVSWRRTYHISTTACDGLLSDDSPRCVRPHLQRSPFRSAMSSAMWADHSKPQQFCRGFDGVPPIETIYTRCLTEPFVARVHFILEKKRPPTDIGNTWIDLRQLQPRKKVLNCCGVSRAVWRGFFHFWWIDLWHIATTQKKC